MQQTKKFLSLLLTLAMIVSLFSGLTLTAHAANTYQVTEATSLTAENTYIIMDPDSTYAMNSDSGYSAGYRGAVAATVSNGTISSENDLEQCLWEYTTDGKLRNVSTSKELLIQGGLAASTSLSGDVWTVVGSGDAIGLKSNYGNSTDYYYVKPVSITSGFYMSPGTFYAVKLYQVVFCEHEPTDAGVVTAPTCTQQGYTTYTCAKCGSTYLSDYIDALGHDTTGATPVVADPTCTEDGSSSYTCARCNESVVETIPALGHDYGEDHLCSRCGALKLETWEDFFYFGGNQDTYFNTVSASAPTSWTVTTYNNAPAIKFGTSYSSTYLTFNAKVSGTISFDYIVYGSTSTYMRTYYDSSLTDTKYGSYNADWSTYSYHMDEGKTFQINPYTYYSNYVYLTNFTFTPDCLHDGATHTNDVAATCTEGAYTETICDLCGNTIGKDYTSEALGHLDAEYTATGDGATHSFTCARESCAGGTEACEFVNNVCTLCGQKRPIIIGDGTDSAYYAPYCNYYKNSTSQMLYTAEEIGQAGVIRAIAFEVGAASSFATTSMKVYLCATSQSTLTSTTYINPDDLTLVYSGAPTLGTATGWETITLDTPFEYNGTDNLVVAVTHTSDGYNSALKYCYTTVNNSVIYRQNDNDTSYADITNTGGTWANTYQYRPNLRLAIEDPEPVEPDPVVTTYEIGTEAELLAFAAKIADGETDADAKLTADITLTADWTPIGTEDQPYTGTFDGNGHTISGLRINSDAAYVGLFGYMKDATVENLIVKGYVRSTATYGSAAGVAAHAAGDCNFNNVGNEAIVISNNNNAVYYAAGGVLGFVETDSSATFNRCYNKGEIVGRTGYAGGIVGGSNTLYVNTDAGINASITLTDCYNLGSISKTGAYGGYVGGIIGYSYDAILTNCYNLGAVQEGYGELAGNKTEDTVGTNCYISGSSVTASQLGDSYKDGIDADAPALTWETAAYTAPVTLTRIEVTTQPTKTSYNTNEAFDPAGMIVTAYYSDESTQVITDYTYPTDQLTEGTTSITISYNDYRTVVNDVTTTVAITVEQIVHTITFDAGEHVTIESGNVGATSVGYAYLYADDGQIIGLRVFDGYCPIILVRVEEGYELDHVTFTAANGTVIYDEWTGSTSYTIQGIDTDGDGVSDTDGVTCDLTVSAAVKEKENPFDGEGSGTAEDPYLIQNEADLRQLAENVNNGIDYYGVCFKMTDDIALTNQWTPIGNGVYYSGNVFKGTFDGGEHTVSGLSIDVSGSAENSKGYGLFGTVSGATIKNLAVAGEITNLNKDTNAGCKSYFGAIAGMAYNNVTLENCASHVDVTNMFYWKTGDTAQAPESAVGGLIGYAYGNTTITGCYSDGELRNTNENTYYGNSAYSCVGGLIGSYYNYSGTASITNSFAYGPVTYTNQSYAGPIVGKNNEGANAKLTATNSYYLTGIAGDASDTTGAIAKSEADFLTLSGTLGSLFLAGPTGHPIFQWEDGNIPTPPPATTPDTDWYTDESDEFTLGTEAELLGFAQLVNAGNNFAGKTVMLNADITVTSAWTAIGQYSANPFSGTFNGQNHTVTLTINNKQTNDYNALFGYISGATITRVIVAGSITGGNYTAGLVGNAYDATIQYCGNEATVSGLGLMGGVVAYANNTSILACYNKGDLTNSATTDVYTGGIAGMAQTCAIVQSYSAGQITGGKYTGGVLGSGNLYYQQGSMSYYLSGSADAGAGTGGDSIDYISAVNADTLKAADGTIVMLGSAYQMPDAETNNGYPILKWETNPNYTYGYLTELYTLGDLKEFANNVKNGYDYADMTVKLMNDIDLGGTYAWETSDVGTKTLHAENIWTAIGDVNGTVFAGTFDGQNNTISGMILANDDSGCLGFFSALDESAAVKNLTLEGNIITQYSVSGDSSAVVGSFVGWNRGGTVENCVSNVEIYTVNYYAVGGIVGDNAGMIKNCVNNGAVNGNTGSSRVGGIAGRMEPGYDYTEVNPAVTGCKNYGDVTGYQYIGGIVGGVWNEDTDTYLVANIENCYNAGEVTGHETSGDYTGTIAGNTCTGITNCYYKLDSTDVPAAGDISGDNYSRPVSEGYDVDQLLRTDSSESSSAGGIHIEQDVWTVNITDTTATVTRLPKAYTSTLDSLTVGNATYAAADGENIVLDKYGNVQQASFRVDYQSDDTVTVVPAGQRITFCVNGQETTYTLDELTAYITEGEWRYTGNNNSGSSYCGIATQYITVDDLLRFLNIGNIESICFRPVDWENNESYIRTLDAQQAAEAVLALKSYQSEDAEAVTATMADGLNAPRLIPSSSITAGFDSVKWIDYISVTGDLLRPTGNPDAQVWDGTLDFRWYDENDVKTEYHISTPAQWEALAWICSEHLAELDELGEGTYTNGNITGITGTVPTKQNTFAGVQFYLDSDIDMGGVYDEQTDTWSGMNYYPIGSQAANDQGNACWYGLFYGSFDGQGHTVSNIYCSRGASKTYQSAGLFGRVGVANNTDTSAYETAPNNIVIENFAVTGYIKSGRSVGGIVGKTLNVGTGYSITIQNCVNYAYVTSTDAKGLGGIVGALWNKAAVYNCINCGTVTNSVQYPCGGIVGDNDSRNFIYNCLNIGKVYSTAIYPYSGALIGSLKGSGDAVNCYYLEGSLEDRYYLGNGNWMSAEYNGKYCTYYGTSVTAEELNASELVQLLNGEDGTAFQADCGSHPVLYWQTATAHSYTAGPVTEPTCSEPGYTTYTCTVCGNNHKADKTDALGHSYEEATVAASCAAEGYTLHTCTVCGYEYRDNIVPALGHSYESVVTKPTCTELGYTTYTCTVCNDSYQADYTAPAGHEWDNGTVITETTHTQDGERSYHCQNCDASYTETIPMLGHSFDEGAVTAPTCTEMGYTTYTCDCGYSYQADYVNPLGHALVFDEAVAPTCTEEGLTAGVHCSVCGEILIAQQTVAALGHSYEDTIIAPTCTEEGYTLHTCTVCGNSYRDNITAATGHHYVETAHINATEATEGSVTYTCDSCGDSYVEVLARLTCPSANFSDVDTAAWYHEGVDFVLARELFVGVGDGEFAPNMAMTRAMLVTVLWRYEGAPTGNKNPFTDVSDGAWYTDAIAWAAEHNIVSGIGNGKFAPEDEITREQMALILLRYTQWKALATEKRSDFDKFADGDAVSSWAEEAVQWAVAENLITGAASGDQLYLDPQGNATRAQVATILMRYIQSVAITE